MSTKSKTAAKKNSNHTNKSHDEEITAMAELPQAPESEPTVDFDSLSIEQLQQHLEAKKAKEIESLEARALSLQTELQQTNNRISELKGTTATRKPRKGSSKPRIRNEKPLVTYVHDILTAAIHPMDAKEIETALGQTDYRSNSENKYVLIHTAMSKHPEMFTKVSRGKYEAKPIDVSEETSEASEEAPASEEDNA